MSSKYFIYVKTAIASQLFFQFLFSTLKSWCFLSFENLEYFQYFFFFCSPGKVFHFCLLVQSGNVLIYFVFIIQNNPIFPGWINKTMFFLGFFYLTYLRFVVTSLFLNEIWFSNISLLHFVQNVWNSFDNIFNWSLWIGKIKFKS